MRFKINPAIEGAIAYDCGPVGADEDCRKVSDSGARVCHCEDDLCNESTTSSRLNFQCLASIMLFYIVLENI